MELRNKKTEILKELRNNSQAASLLKRLLGVEIEILRDKSEDESGENDLRIKGGIKECRDLLRLIEKPDK